MKAHPRVLFAGQICGVEGYVESIATGLMAGMHAAALVRGDEPLPPPRASAFGSLTHYVTHADAKNFQPANITFDLLPAAGTENPRPQGTAPAAVRVGAASSLTDGWNRPPQLRAKLLNRASRSSAECSPRKSRFSFLTHFPCNKSDRRLTYLHYEGINRRRRLTFPARLASNQRSAMTLRDLFRDVLRTLWAHKLRAFLTMFGIAWGIVSIVLMVAAGEGLRKGQEEQARNLGKDVMIVFHGRTSLQAGGTHAGRAGALGRSGPAGSAGRDAGLPICDSRTRAGDGSRAQQFQQCRVHGHRIVSAVCLHSHSRCWPGTFLRLGRHARGAGAWRSWDRMPPSNYFPAAIRWAKTFI